MEEKGTLQKAQLTDLLTQRICLQVVGNFICALLQNYAASDAAAAAAAADVATDADAVTVGDAHCM